MEHMLHLINHVLLFQMHLIHRIYQVIIDGKSVFSVFQVQEIYTYTRHMYSFILGGNYSDTDIVNIGDDTIDFILETKEETQFLSEKFYTWIKCNRNFQGFYVTEYSSEISTISNWQRFSLVLEAQPTVSFI